MADPGVMWKMGWKWYVANCWDEATARRAALIMWGTGLYTELDLKMIMTGYADARGVYQLPSVN